MKFATLILAAVAAVATASVVEVTAPAPAIALDLEARQGCVPTPNCTCNRVQGQVCGNEAINRFCTNGHVFECSASTGQTCDYGIRNSCVQCGRLVC